MKMQLLTGVAALALVTAATATLAQDNEANNNAGIQAVTQDNSGDVAAAGGNAVEDGAHTTAGNAVGKDTDDNAVAYQNSTATQVEAQDAEAVATNGSLAAENGAVVGGNGVAIGNNADDNAVVYGNGVAVNAQSDEIADEGSAVLIGEGNSAAAAEDNSASANWDSTALYSYDGDIADNGSAVVIGDGNSTAAAEEGAAVGGSGTAVGVDNINVFADDVTAAFGEGNVVAGAHLKEVNVVSTKIGFFGFGNDFNAPASLELGGDDPGIFIDGFAKVAGVVAFGPNASVTTGDINTQHLGSLTGANMFAGNTGIANQGDAIGVAASSSF